MPIRIPRVSPGSLNPTFQSSSDPVSPTAARAAASGNQIASALSNASNTAFNISEAEGRKRAAEEAAAEKERLRKLNDENDRLAKEADIAFSRELRGLLHGEEGFYTRKSGDAVNNRAEIEEAIREAEKRISSDISDPTVANTFSQAARARIETELKQVDTYTEKERSVAQIETSQARVDEAINDISANYNNPDVVRRSQIVVESEILEQGEQSGWSPEVIQDKLKESRTLMYAGAINNALSQGKMDEAKAIFNERAEVMDAGTVTDIQEKIEQNDQMIEIQATSDALVAKLGGDPEAALKEARSIRDPKVRNGVVAKVKSQLAEIKSRVEKKEKEDFSEFFQGVSVDGKSVEELAVANPEKYREMAADPNKLRQLQAAELAYAERRTYALVSDGTTFADILQNHNDKELLDLNLAEYQPMLTPTEFSKLQTAQKGAQEKYEEKDPFKAAKYEKGLAALKQFAPQLNIGKEGQDPAALAAINEMNSFIAEKNANEEPLELPDIQEKALALATPGETSSDFFREGFFEGEGTDPTGIVATVRQNIMSFIGAGKQDIIAAELEGLTDEEFQNARIPLENLTPQSVSSLKGVFSQVGVDNPTEDLLEAYFIADSLDDDEMREAILTEAISR